MKVFVAAYKGNEDDDILGVFADIEQAKAAIHKDYSEAEFGYTPDIEHIDDTHIYIEKKCEWYDEWYIVETELHN